MRSRKSSTPEQLGLHWDAPGLVAGVDEAGRGPLAGPVVAAAVILDELQPIRGLGDSKVISPARRERLFDEIRAKALCCCIAEASVEEIDALNILQATLLAMRRAVEGLRLAPHKVLVDGNRLPVLRTPAEAIVKGDAKVAAISAASILAKVHRDRLCMVLHEAHPQYGFAEHKGYSTPEHLAQPVPMHLRQDGRGRDRLHPRVAPDDRLGRDAQHRQPVAVDQHPLRHQPQPFDRAAHRQHRGLQDVDAVDLLDARLADAAAQRLGADLVVEALARGRREQLRVGQATDAALVVEDHRRRHHRAGQRPAARLVDAGHQADAAPAEREAELLRLRGLARWHRWRPGRCRAAGPGGGR